MRYKSLKCGEPINVIVSSEEFVADFCAKHGYTYKEEPVIDLSPAPDPEHTTEDRVAALEAENKLLKEQVSAQADHAEFYEDCIAEMAMVVYA